MWSGAKGFWVGLQDKVPSRLLLGVWVRLRVGQKQKHNEKPLCFCFYVKNVKVS